MKAFGGFFEGKRGLIIGATSGIGKELARQFLDAGATVRIAGHNAQRLEAALEALAPYGARVSGARIDATREAEVFSGVEQAAKDLGRLDYIVNNAGVLYVEPVQDISLERFRSIMDLNFWGVIYGCYAALPIMLRQGGGHIVNMASLSGIIPTPFQAAYVASKFAVLGFTETLRYEMEAKGIAVTALCPGDVQSDIARNSVRALSPKRYEALATDEGEKDKDEDEAKPDLFKEGRITYASASFACREMMEGLAMGKAVVTTPGDFLEQSCKLSENFPYFARQSGQDIVRLWAKGRQNALNAASGVYNRFL